MSQLLPENQRSNLSGLIQGPLGRLAIVAGFLSFVYLALKPFDWDPPVHFDNGAQFLENGNLEFRKYGIFYEAAPPAWIPTAMESGTFTLDLNLRSLLIRPGGPDRIVTLAKDQFESNLMIGQDFDALVVRLFDPNNPNEKTRFIEVTLPAFFKAGEWRQVQLEVAQNSLKILADGVQLAEQILPQKNMLMHWNPTHLLAFGNEHNGRRAWLGEIAEARIVVGNEHYDLLKSNNMILPEDFWSARFSPRIDSLLKFRVDQRLVVDYLANLIFFIPLGALVVARKIAGWSALRATVICGLASLGVETAQIFFEECFPSIYDLGLNTLGATMGALVSIRILKDD